MKFLITLLMTCGLTLTSPIANVSADTVQTTPFEQVDDRNQVLAIQHQDEVKQQHQRNRRQEQRWFNNFKNFIVIIAIVVFVFSLF